MFDLKIHFFWNVVTLIAGIVLMFFGTKVRKRDKIGNIQLLLGLLIVLVDIVFVSKFICGGFFSQSIHVFWERMGVISGFILIPAGFSILSSSKKIKSKLIIGIWTMLFGLANIIGDSIFLSSW